MIGLSISLLWIIIGVIILALVIWIGLNVIKRFMPIAPNIEMAIWSVFGILILIYVLTALVGGGFAHPGFRSLN